MHADLGNNPIMRWLGVLLIKPSITDSYDQGLANIAAQCKNLQNQDWYYVTVKTQDAINYYGILDEVNIDELSDKMGEFYTKIYTALGKNGIQPSGAPFAIYYTWGKSVKMLCGVPVADNSTMVKGIPANTLESAKHAVIKSVGSYENSQSPHKYMDKWLKTNKFEVAGPVVEIYELGPMQEQDSSKYLTYIMYAIK